MNPRQKPRPTIEEVLVRSLAFKQLPGREECRRLRREHRVSQQNLAEAIGVNRSSICLWESGKRNPNAEHIVAYVRFYEALRVIDHLEE